MTCTDKCRFCSILNGDKTFENNIDVPIFENDEYYLLASIGAMIEGWSLVIPKSHEYSLRKLYKSSSFLDFTNRSIEVIKKAYDVEQVIIFEHGAGRFDSLTSCGTNHCHLHIVPLTESLLEDVMSIFEFKKVKLFDVESFVKNSEYLLYADVANDINYENVYVHILKQPISQFFRRIIAQKKGIPQKYNYKEHPNISISEKTYEKLRREVF